MRPTFWFGTLATFVVSACGGRVEPGPSGAGASGTTSNGGAETGGSAGDAGTGGSAGHAETGGAGGTAEPGGTGGTLETGGTTAAGGASGSSAGGSSGTSGEGGDDGGAASGCGDGVAQPGEVCAQPSCAGLAKTCGPNGDADCCESPVVTRTEGATFFRSYDGVRFVSQANPARVSDFRLDKYEITVGRFRKFVAAYSRTMIAEGAGANPKNPSDTGWSAAWNANLPPDATALSAALQCASPYQTWTDDVGTARAETLPINCLDWYEAEAFCIWDAGRLPTEAEWNYAASGGTQQRVHAWGNEAPDCSYANFFGRAGGSDFCVQPAIGATNGVGSESPKGDGRFGQTDLAGNISEWVQDFHAPYVNPCDDCANLTAGSHRVVRGGSFFDSAPVQVSSFRGNADPSERDPSIGTRCARTGSVE